MQGSIFNFQRFSVDDGPGIRTAVFFQGCPLSCIWCHNPEGLDFATDKKHVYSVDAAMSHILRDRQFYEETRGGVTFTGGECMAQIDFLEALAKKCKRAGIDVAIDTSGHAPWESFERILEACDLFLYDIKIVNPQKHKELTGRDNGLILENLQKLSRAGARIWLRFPLIGGINLDEEHIAGLADICRDIRHESIHLLPYHPLAGGKLEKMGKPPINAVMEQPTQQQLAKIRARLADCQLVTPIQG